MARACLLLALLLAASVARADSVCEQGYRDTTPEERATVVRTLEAAKAALPPPQQGWVIGGYEEVSAPTSLCRDRETVPWAYNVSRTYNRADNVVEREKALEEQGAALRASMAAKQPRMDALMAKNQALAGELATAAQANDQTRVDAINAQLQALSKEFETLMNEGPSPEAQAAAVAATMRDVNASIAVAVNPGAVGTADMQPASAPPGAAHAFRGQTTNDGVPEGHALVLLGAWRPRDGGGFETTRRGDAAPAAAHTISVSIQADPARIDALLGGIDFAALNALVR